MTDEPKVEYDGFYPIRQAIPKGCGAWQTPGNGLHRWSLADASGKIAASGEIKVSPVSSADNLTITEA